MLNPADQPPLNTEEFWIIHYPEVAQSTRDFYQNYINKISTEIAQTKDLVNFFDPKESLKKFGFTKKESSKEFLKKFGFTKKWQGIYWNAPIDKYQPRYVEAIEQSKRGENLNQKTVDEQTIAFGALDDLRERVFAHQEIDLEYLFGMYLPPRRMEIYSTRISRDPNKFDNTYNPDTGLFTLKAVKKTRKTDQTTFRFHLHEFNFVPVELLNRIRTALSQILDDELIINAGTNTSRWVTETFGVNNNFIRSYWSEIGKKVMEHRQHLTLTRWMGHSLQTSVITYST